MPRCASLAERPEVIDGPAKSHALLQHLSTKLGSVIVEVPELATSHNNPRGEPDAIVPDGIKISFSETSRMMVLAMLLLITLMCILIDVIGRFLSHVADIVMDDCEAVNESLREPEKQLTALAFIRLLGAVHLATRLGSAYVKLEKGVTAERYLPRPESLLRHLALVYLDDKPGDAVTRGG
eukprot:Skav207829  [mRNA]  locus=scaffold3131:15920:27801:- [translate_table: standard]